MVEGLQNTLGMGMIIVMHQSEPGDLRRYLVIKHTRAWVPIDRYSGAEAEEGTRSGTCVRMRMTKRKVWAR